MARILSSRQTALRYIGQDRRRISSNTEILLHLSGNGARCTDFAIYGQSRFRRRPNQTCIFTFDARGSGRPRKNSLTAGSGRGVFLYILTSCMVIVAVGRLLIMRTVKNKLHRPEPPA